MWLMLVPQFSLRFLMFVVACAAPVCLALGYGVRGHAWAIAVGVGGLALVFSLMIHALLFVAVWGVARLAGRRLPPGGGLRPAEAARGAAVAAEASGFAE